MSSSIYQSLLEELRADILAQRIAPGALLGTEVGLARRSGISRNSVRTVIDQLAGEGLVERRRGKGVYVCHRTNMTLTIELIVPTLGDFWEGIARGAQLRALEHGTKLHIYNANLNVEADRAALRALPSSSVNGALIGSLHQPELHEEFRALHRQGFPFALLDDRLPGLDVPTVVIDGWQAGQMAAQQLLAAGHRQIGFVGYTEGELIRRRLDGVRDAVNDAGLPFDRTAVIALPLANLVGKATDDWQAALRALLLRPNRPTALIIHNEKLLRNVFDCVRELGWQIPADISVVTFGTGKIAELFLPTVSTILLPTEAMGRAAMELLLARLQDPNQSVQHRTEHGIWHDGQSIAPPPSRV